VRYFLQRHRALRPLGVSPAAADALVAYDWPGNVRELERFVESALTLASGSALDVDDLPAALRTPSAETLFVAAQQHESLREWSRRYVNLVYQRCGENKREACRVLGISYHTLRAHLRRPTWAAPEATPPGPALLAHGPAVSLVHERGAYTAGEPRAPAPVASG
jgi:DNA-binding NtrC family response regulator